MDFKKPYDPNISACYIDVRSEHEFEQGHIKGAYNLPILNNEERHIVGDCYKNNSIDEAKRLGLKFAADKVVAYFDLVRSLQEKNPEKMVFFYCSRGGFRSRSITQLLRGIGVDVRCLEGGYKDFRNRVLAFLDNADNFPEFIMLHGYTGVGKTELLHALILAGEPVLDLEGDANHKGSHLGSIGTDCKQSQQQFENNVYDCLTKMNQSYCFVESESKRIGSVFISPKLFEALRMGGHILIERDLDIRVNALILEYCFADNFDELVKPALDKIKRYLSNEVYESLCNDLKAKRYDHFAKILLINHYDPVYQKSIKNYTYDFTCSTNDLTEAVNDIINWLSVKSV